MIHCKYKTIKTQFQTKNTTGPRVRPARIRPSLRVSAKQNVNRKTPLPRRVRTDSHFRQGSGSNNLRIYNNSISAA